MKRLLLILALALPLYGADYETTFEAEANPTTYTNFADSTDFACSGTESAKTTSSTGSMGVGSATTNQVWWGGYIYITSLPAAQLAIAAARGSAGAIRCNMFLETDGRLTAAISGGTDNSSTETVATGAWHYLEFKCDTSQSAGSDISEIRLNASVVAAATNGSTTGSIIDVRWFDAHSSGATYWDDVYLHDTTLAYRGHSAGCGSLFGSDNKYKSVVIGD